METAYIILCLPHRGLCLPVHKDGRPETFGTRDEAEQRAEEMRRQQPDVGYVVREAD